MLALVTFIFYILLFRDGDTNQQFTETGQNSQMQSPMPQHQTKSATEEHESSGSTEIYIEPSESATLDVKRSDCDTLSTIKTSVQPIE